MFSFLRNHKMTHAQLWDQEDIILWFHSYEKTLILLVPNAVFSKFGLCSKQLDSSQLKECVI